MYNLFQSLDGFLAMWGCPDRPKAQREREKAQRERGGERERDHDPLVLYACVWLPVEG